MVKFVSSFAVLIKLELKIQAGEKFLAEVQTKNMTNMQSDCIFVIKSFKSKKHIFRIHKK
ncbi:MAG: hypothetical protein KR126chlam6_00776 [Candidatus Anoxychlamydiales bacterium]|nr:hypothetical protein [Candidatus Anoxychlamydiales bacterium]